MSTDDKPGAAARAGRRRASEKRHAGHITARGWICFLPEDADAILGILETVRSGGQSTPAPYSRVTADQTSA